MPRLLFVLISPQRGQQSEERRRAREKERKGEGGNGTEGESSRIGGGPGRPASTALGSQRSGGAMQSKGLKGKQRGSAGKVWLNGAERRRLERWSKAGRKKQREEAE